MRAPFPGPLDPSHCGLKLSGGDCTRTPRPEGVSGACWNDGSAECFWKRHAHSWGIRCSACWSDEACGDCNELIGGPDAEAAALLRQRLAAEKAVFGDDDLVIAISPHFYVVTNLHKKLKLVTERNTRRIMTAHEVAHLYAERCERAYADFVHWFGEPVLMQKPMAVYIVETDDTARDVGEAYFGKAGIHMNYAFAYNDRIANGFCGNGFVVAAKNEGADQHVHGFARHQIGHILFSCWQLQGGFEEQCPRWAWVGAAHFLEKMVLELHDDYATFCYGETDGGTGPRDRWSHRVKMMSRKDRWSPIETFFGINSLSDMRYEDHLRAWSFMDLMLREDRDRWLDLLTKLRNGTDEGTAFREALGFAPEQFHERWLERVREKRESMADAPREGTPEADALKRLEQLRDGSKPEVLAGRIRGLESRPRRRHPRCRAAPPRLRIPTRARDGPSPAAAHESIRGPGSLAQARPRPVRTRSSVSAWHAPSAASPISSRASPSSRPSAIATGVCAPMRRGPCSRSVKGSRVATSRTPFWRRRTTARGSRCSTPSLRGPGDRPR